MGPERGVAKDNLVRLVENYVETRETVQAKKLYAVRVHCTQGRHRTIMIIEEGIKIVEALGGSWTVCYHSLYVGVPEFNWDRNCRWWHGVPNGERAVDNYGRVKVDDRGVCGCFYHPSLCRYPKRAALARTGGLGSGEYQSRKKGR